MGWLFEGLGTEILSIIIGLLIGGVGGYRIGIKKYVKQNQRANDNVNQFQIGNIHGKTNTESRE